MGFANMSPSRGCRQQCTQAAAAARRAWRLAQLRQRAKQAAGTSPPQLQPLPPSPECVAEAAGRDCSWDDLQPTIMGKSPQPQLPQPVPVPLLQRGASHAAQQGAGLLKAAAEAARTAASLGLQAAPIGPSPFGVQHSMQRSAAHSLPPVRRVQSTAASGLPAQFGLQSSPASSLPPQQANSASSQRPPAWTGSPQTQQPQQPQQSAAQVHSSALGALPQLSACPAAQSSAATAPSALPGLQPSSTASQQPLAWGVAPQQQQPQHAQGALPSAPPAVQSAAAADPSALLGLQPSLTASLQSPAWGAAPLSQQPQTSVAQAHSSAATQQPSSATLPPAAALPPATAAAPAMEPYDAVIASEQAGSPLQPHSPAQRPAASASQQLAGSALWDVLATLGHVPSLQDVAVNPAMLMVIWLI